MRGSGLCPVKTTVQNGHEQIQTTPSCPIFFEEVIQHLLPEHRKQQAGTGLHWYSRANISYRN